MWKSYIKERENKDVFETETGFAIYLITGEECYLVDIYVDPKHRRSRESFAIADKVSEIAKAKGCKYLTGTVATNSPGSTASLKMLLAYGMRLVSSNTNGLVFIKDL